MEQCNYILVYNCRFNLHQQCLTFTNLITVALFTSNDKAYIVLSKYYWFKRFCTIALTEAVKYS